MRTVYFLETEDQITWFRTEAARNQYSGIYNEYEIDDDEVENWRFEEDK